MTILMKWLRGEIRCGRDFSEASRKKALFITRAHPGKLAADIGAGTSLTEGLILKVIALGQER